MTDISSNLENPASEASSESVGRHRSYRNSRRRRSLYSTISRQLDKMLRTRKIFRAGFVLLPLAGFLHISLINDVLSPDENVSDEFSAVALSNTRSPTPETQQASTWSTDGLTSARLPPDGAERVEERPVGGTNAEPMLSDTRVTGDSIRTTNTYIVNEGGSLWRTGKRFIDDEVLLDKLIDNLSDSGMNVRSVSAGVEFIVNDLGSKGLLVVVEDGDDTYESRIVRNSVTSSVRP